MSIGLQMSSLAYLPLSLFMVIYQTMPLLASLMAFVLFGTRIRPLELCAMISCFTAVVVIIFNSKVDPVDESVDPALCENSLHLFIGVVMATLTTIVSAINGVSSTLLMNLHYSKQLFYVAMFGIVALIVYHTFNLYAFDTLPNFVHLSTR